MRIQSFLKNNTVFFAVIVSAGVAITGCGARTSTVKHQTGTNAATTAAPDNNDRQADSSGDDSSNMPGPLMIGATAPSFTLRSLDGKGTTSLQQLLSGGKPVLINAWASWCPPCNIETPDLVKMSQKYGSKLQFIGVNLTSMDDEADTQAFVRRYQVPYPILLDTKGTFLDKYTVIAEPMTYLISPQGKVLSIHMGMLTTSQMEDLIQSAIS